MRSGGGFLGTIATTRLLPNREYNVPGHNFNDIRILRQLVLLILLAIYRTDKGKNIYKKIVFRKYLR